MEPTLVYYEFLLTCLTQLGEMVESENVPGDFHPKSQQITKEILEAVVDFVAIIQREVIKLKFWDYVLSDEWCRKHYYSRPDTKNWEDEEEEDG